MDDAGLAQVAAKLGHSHEDLERIAKYLYFYMQMACLNLQNTSVDLRVRQIETVRIKSPESVGRSLDDQALTAADVWMIDDMIGGRIVVGSPSDVDPLIAAMQEKPEKFGLLELSRLDGNTGYRAHHLKGRYLVGDIAVGCEIQIRTALQDAWAFSSRADLYHGQDVPEMMQTIAAIQSRHLAAIDDTFELVRGVMRHPLPSSLRAEPKEGQT